MKNYEEVAKSVFEKSEKYFEHRKKCMRIVKTVTISLSCLILGVTAVSAAAALKTPYNVPEESILSEYTAISSQSDTADITVTSEDSTDTEENNAEVTEYTEDPDIAVDTGEPVPPVETSVNEDLEWLTPEEISFDTNGGGFGVNSPFLIAYNGALYVGYDPEDEKTDRYYALTGDMVQLSERYNTPAYAVKDEPNLIGVFFNFGVSEYRRLFTCQFDLDGVNYEISYSPIKDIDLTCGEKVLETDDYTVFEALDMQGEPIQGKYLVNLFPLIQAELPNLFNEAEKETYSDIWWVAVPTE